MTLKFITTTFIIGLFFNSCSLVKKAADSPSSGDHTSENSLDWQGTYSGITPCGSCPGIETELTLTSDRNYVLTRKYIDKEGTDKIEGSFAWEGGGNQIHLKGIKHDDAATMYKVEEGRIRQLDLNGKAIEGELANNYVLTKDGNTSVEDKRWKLIELFGKPVTGSAETHYIIFHSKDGRVEAKANCNVILSSYKIRNQYRLEITPGITTMMACPDNLEKELIEAMAQADNLSVSQTNLTLNKARMSPLARFELAPSRIL